MRISMKILLSDLCAAITQSKVTPIPTYPRPSKPPHRMPLIQFHKKRRSIYPNRCGKQDSTYPDPKHDSSGSKDTITDKLDRSGSNPMTMEYTAKDAPVVIPWYPKYDSYGSNTKMSYERERFGSNPMITEYTTKDTPVIFTINVNANIRRSQVNHQSTNKNDDDTSEAGNETEILFVHVTLLFKVTASNNAWKQNVEAGSIISGKNPTYLVQTKIPPTLSFSGVYWKPFIYRRNMTNLR